MYFTVIKGWAKLLLPCIPQFLCHSILTKSAFLRSASKTDKLCRQWQSQRRGLLRLLCGQEVDLDSEARPLWCHPGHFFKVLEVTRSVPYWDQSSLKSSSSGQEQELVHSSEYRGRLDLCLRWLASALLRRKLDCWKIAWKRCLSSRHFRAKEFQESSTRVWSSPFDLLQNPDTLIQ